MLASWGVKTLYVRDVPDDIYEALRQRASAEGRSISAETITILRRMVADDLVRRAQVRQRIEARRVRYGSIDMDAAALIREDRDS